MVVGIFLNSVVIISLWRSRQLRKKLCYFMILVLSCFDLAVVTITHPLLISSTIYFPREEIKRIRENGRTSIAFILSGFSMTALFTLNVERLLAITCPFFHQASVTKTRLLCFLAFLSTIIVSLAPLINVNTKTVIFVNIFAAVCISLLLFLLIYSNYKMFIIAKSKCANERVTPTTATSVDEKRKKRALNLKNFSACSLAVCCFFLCSSPQIFYSGFRLATGAPPFNRQILLFNLWAGTFASINSTLNCVIFFWRNSILRREGMKIISALRAHVIN